jgi:hypothetical protein
VLPKNFNCIVPAELSGLKLIRAKLIRAKPHSLDWGFSTVHTEKPGLVTKKLTRTTDGP